MRRTQTTCNNTCISTNMHHKHTLPYQHITHMHTPNWWMNLVISSSLNGWFFTSWSKSHSHNSITRTMAVFTSYSDNETMAQRPHSLAITWALFQLTSTWYKWTTYSQFFKTLRIRISLSKFSFTFGSCLKKCFCTTFTATSSLPS